MGQFTVKVKDKSTGQEFDCMVDGNDIKTQADAEAHVAALPNARGGTHAGLEVIPSAAPAPVNEETETNAAPAPGTIPSPVASAD